MKLKEYLDLRVLGDEVTCWDKDIDSEFYFYAKEDREKPIYGDEFPNVDRLDGLLREHLDVVKVHNNGIEVNLYELLENPKIVEFAKKHMFDELQYEDDSDVSLLLFDDNVVNFSQGIEGFSELMANAIEFAFSATQELDTNIPVHDFADDEEKMRDFHELSKEEFLESYSYLTEAEYDATEKALLSAETEYDSVVGLGLKAVNIEWDVDHDEDDELLPREIDIPEGIIDEEEISDYLTDMTGFCHKGFCVVDSKGMRVDFNDYGSLEMKIASAKIENENAEHGPTMKNENKNLFDR